MTSLYRKPVKMSLTMMSSVMATYEIPSQIKLVTLSCLFLSIQHIVCPASFYLSSPNNTCTMIYILASHSLFSVNVSKCGSLS